MPVCITTLGRTSNSAQAYAFRNYYASKTPSHFSLLDEVVCIAQKIIGADYGGITCVI